MFIGYRYLLRCPKLNLSPKLDHHLFPVFMRDTTIYLDRFLLFACLLAYLLACFPSFLPSFLVACGSSQGQGSNLSCSCNLQHSFSSAGSLTHCAGLGIEPALPQRQARLLTHCTVAGNPWSPFLIVLSLSSPLLPSLFSTFFFFLSF